MNTQQIKDKLKELHEREAALNYELSQLDLTIKRAEFRKKKIAISISKNVKYRHLMVNKLSESKV